MKKLMICLGFLVVILLPIIAYWWQFGFTPFSRKYSDWAAFGDYVGGTVNTIVAIISLLVLAWITYLVSKNTNEASRKQQLVLRRMDAYQVLANHVPRFNLMSERVRMRARYINNLARAPESVSPNDFASAMLNVQKEFHSFAEMRETIRSFPVCHGYLFDYDFKDEPFNELLKSSQETLDAFNKIESSILNAEKYDVDKEVDPSEKFLSDLTEFINALLDELEF